MIRFSTLGSLDLRNPGGDEIAAVVRKPKQVALLAYLATAPPHAFHRRDTLLGLLWPESDETSARTSLRQALYKLRQALGDGVLVGRGDEELGLAEGRFWSDAAAFEEAVEQGELATALEIYRGDFLEGFFLPGAPAYEEWLGRVRAGLRAKGLEAARELASREEQRGNLLAAVRWTRRAMEVDPDSEVDVRRLMLLLDRAGDRAGALRAYENFARRLETEQEAEPAPETRALLQAIRVREEASPVAVDPSAVEPLPPAVPAAVEFANVPPSAADAPAPTRSPLGWRGAAWAAGVVFALLGAAGVVQGAGALLRGGDAAWARTTGLPLLERYVEEEKWDSAWAVAARVEEALPGDSALEALRPRFARRVSIRTQVPGARVFHRFYSAGDTTWRLVGRTPLESVWLPGGVAEVRIEKPGYETLRWTGYEGLASPVRLDRVGSLPDGMVRVQGGEFAPIGTGLGNLPKLRLGDFLIDRYEVTNREYKRFVDAGGYRRRDLWGEPFLREGRTVAWENAVPGFVDRTGRPGPSTWVIGDYPEGEDDHPVAGISWYEAAAYAKFVGKSLPTVYHWNRAAGTPMGAAIIPKGNFGYRGTRPVRASRALSAYGAYDMAGNVREWCLNDVQDKRLILGGGWDDALYMFSAAFAQSPWDRSATNGVRLAKYLDRGNVAPAGARLPHAVRDLLAERPVSEEVFAAYRRMFAYDRTPLNTRVEKVDSSKPGWVEELVSFDAAYGNERMAARVLIPRGGRPPYQTVLWFPGTYAAIARSSGDLTYGGVHHAEFFLKSGRAVVLPILKGTYERNEGLRETSPNESNAYREYVIAWTRDVSRTLDYLEERKDVDTGRIAYYGVSWGGRMGPTVLAVEPRFKAAVLFVGGLHLNRSQPEVDPVNFAPRVKVPVLMLNGRYDHIMSLEQSQLPLLKLLGTPSEHRRHLVYETAHTVPWQELVKESLGWLDQYLGPVR